MIIQSMEYSGYGSFYGPHKFVWRDRGLVMLVGENNDEPRMNSNGSGKSTLPDCLDWILFGEIPRKDHVDSIINDESPEVFGAVYLFDDELGLPLVVRRSKTRGKAGSLEFALGDVLTKTHDTVETQRLLNIALGLDRSIFHSAVLFAQTDVKRFADSTGGECLKMLTKILPELADVDVVADNLAPKLSKARAELGTQESLLEQARSDYRLLVEARDNADSHVRNWNDAQSRRIQEAQASVERARIDVASVFVFDTTVTEQTLAGAQQQRADYVSQLDTLLAGYSVDLAKALAAGTNARSEQDVLKYKVDSIVAEKLAKSGLEGTCSTCGQIIGASHVAQEVSRLEASEVGVRSEYEAMGGELDRLRKAYADLEVERNQCSSEKSNMIGRIDGEIEWLIQEIDRLNSERSRAEGLTTVLQQTELFASQIVCEVNPFLGEKEEADCKLAATQRHIEAAGVAIGVLKGDLLYLDFWSVGLGPKGLKSYILDTRLQEMTDAANKWVQLITGGTIWIRFESQKMGRSKKKLANELSTRVFRYNPSGTVTERNYKSWSGGEKKRVSWAIDFGLSRLVASRASKRYDLLVLDEIFSYVDASGGEAVVEMLSKLNAEKNSIFVIEQSSDFKSHFEDTVTVELTNRRSVVNEIGGG